MTEMSEDAWAVAIVLLAHNGAIAAWCADNGWSPLNALVLDAESWNSLGWLVCAAPDRTIPPAGIRLASRDFTTEIG
jgi:hypothetical protein